MTDPVLIVPSMRMPIRGDKPYLLGCPCNCGWIQQTQCQQCQVWVRKKPTCSAALAAVGGSGRLGLGLAEGLHIHILIQQGGSHALDGLHPFLHIQVILRLHSITVIVQVFIHNYNIGSESRQPKSLPERPPSTHGHLSHPVPAITAT